MSDPLGADESSAQLQTEVEANILTALSAAKHLQDKFLVYVLAMAVEHLAECRKSNRAAPLSSR